MPVTIFIELVKLKYGLTLDMNTMFDLYVHSANFFSRISAIDVNMYIVIK